MSCALNKISLPISGEVNHQIGDCYCYLCTCGNHKCPSNSNYRRKSPGMFQTAYRTAYLKKIPSTTSPIIQQDQLLHSKQKMELKTMHQTDFKPTEDIFNSPASDKANSTSPFKFYSTSTYQSNFPDWKNYNPIISNSPTKFSRYSMKFTGVSTYGKDFSKHSRISNVVKSYSKSPSLLGRKDWETGKTTNQLSYRPYKIKLQKNKRNASQEVTIPIHGFKNVSTYQQTFLPHLSPTKILTKRRLPRFN